MNLADFLLARYAELELRPPMAAHVAAARAVVELHASGESGPGVPHECPAWKWRDPDILADQPRVAETGWTVDCLTLRYLARPFAAHPDYRQEWTP